MEATTVTVDVKMSTDTHTQTPQPAPEPVEPWLRFPPFPKPPPGVTIVPFKSFKPSGIVIRLDPDSDEPEVDGSGIPTVALRAKHDLTEAEQSRRKKKKTTVVVAATGATRRLYWFEEWEDGEQLRKTICAIDPSLSRVDRIHQACQDFKNGRTWPLLTSGVPQLWDTFRLYIGIISSIQPPRKKGIQVEEEEEEEDVDMDDPVPNEPKVLVVDEAEARTRREETQPERPTLDDAALERIRRRGEAKESRMEFFFNDPEMAFRIFLSAHFRDKGLIWSEQRCRDAPILLQFFVNFVLRNHILPEYEKSLRRSLVVLETAKTELPSTFVMAKALPDRFGAGCTGIWGEMTKGMFWQDDDTDDNTKEPKVDPTAEERDRKQKDLEEFKAAVGETNVELIDPETDIDFDKQAHMDAVADNVDINGAEVQPTAASWGDSSEWATASAVPLTEEGSTTGGDNGGWGVPDKNPWDEGSAGADWAVPVKNALIEFMGPTVLPLTHTTGIVERSTRRIVKLVPPPENERGAGGKGKGAKKGKGQGKIQAELVEEELEQRFGYIVLAPWEKVGNHERSDVISPEFLPDSRGAVIPDPTEQEPIGNGTDSSGPSAPAHDPSKDEVKVLVEPATLQKMVLGMGLGATYVQIARKAGEDDIEEQAKGKSKKDRKKGGPGKNGEPTKWWYIEQLTTILPSYHADRTC